jgi:hypothetical protein
MWFRRRRRRQPLPVLLPSLDRLAEQIERVVALLDQISLAPVTTSPAPATDGWVAFVHSPDGYRLFPRDGSPPEQGAVVELDAGAFLVVGLGPSPLPGDRRRCAFLERKERPAAERTFDG